MNLRRWISGPPNAPGLWIVQCSTGDYAVWSVKISLPPAPPEPNDIVSGELTVKIGDSAEQTIATTKEQTEVTGLEGAQGDRVLASFAYIDDADNPSEHPSTVDVVLSDTVPPADPGTLGLTVTGET